MYHLHDTGKSLRPNPPWVRTFSQYVSISLNPVLGRCEAQLLNVCAKGRRQREIHPPKKKKSLSEGFNNQLLFPASAWPKDCSEIPRGSHSGVYIIQPKGLHHLVVYCEMNVTHGGWTVIQRNQRDTPVTWAESWSTYKFGFGNVRTEYWLGTEYIHQIAKQKVYQVRFVIQDSADNLSFADYNLFSVEDESHGYRLRLGSYNGTAGDAMTSDNPNSMHDNMKFSTKDQDQDTYSKNCAYSYEGGWWYSSCYSVRLNYKGGMTWGNLCKGNCKDAPGTGCPGDRVPQGEGAQGKGCPSDRVCR
uniref:Fibrinogen C-terminal domain-containing protein n=1 Tax=Taeniopygia guttata TaxID=59729 RepID=A0A674GDT4_TAEGU